MNMWTEPQRDSLFTSVDGIRLHYKRAGSGPSVLLLHGSASSLHHFEQVARQLAESFDVIRPDLPGHGLTGPRADRDYRIPAFVSTIVRFIETLDLQPCAVVGNSLGGNIAWNLALDRPDLVSQLVLVNATGYPEKELPAGLRLARNPLLRPMLRRVMPRRAIERNLRTAVGPHSTLVDADMVERSYQLMHRPGNLPAFIDLVNTDQADRSSQVSKISTPTLVLRSASIGGQRFAQDISSAEEQIHPGGGHLLPEEEPDWVGGAIEAFLHKHSGERA